jgi:phenylacetate-CoA ligase
MPSEYHTKRRVEFAETDMAGIVHFANFFRYMETTEHEFLRSLGLSVHATIDGRTISWPRIRALRRLLGEVAATNRFYGPILREAGLDGNIADLATFVAQMPLTCKAAVVEDQRRHPPFGTNLTYALESYSRFNQTSATTGGSPLRWLDTPESWQGLLDNWKQVYRAAGVTRWP